MVITYWILVVVFSLFAIDNIRQYFQKGLNWVQLIFMVLSILIAAFAIGQIYSLAA